MVETENRDGTLQGEALLRQHQELIRLVAVVKNAASSLEAEDTAQSRQEALSLTEELIGKLVAHFRAENASLGTDFDDQPEIRTALLALDRQHPELIAEFQKVSQSIKRGSQPCKVVALLDHAIGRFQQHEDRESALFY